MVGLRIYRWRLWCPTFGPVLMVLLCLRLYRGFTSQDDFWLLQGWAFSEIDSGYSPVGPCLLSHLLPYVVTAAATLAASKTGHDGQTSAWVTGPLSQQLTECVDLR
jgi:hypothetical protein